VTDSVPQIKTQRATPSQEEEQEEEASVARAKGIAPALVEARLIIPVSAIPPLGICTDPVVERTTPVKGSWVVMIM